MQQSQHDNVGGDDLPSYEEMLVEALAACSDPEGCAPKDLFSWMAARYPLQSNFRPSASQALQKAYKRGRFEKGSNGKYRLNAGYIGANVSDLYLSSNPLLVLKKFVDDSSYNAPPSDP